MQNPKTPQDKIDYAVYLSHFLQEVTGTQLTPEAQQGYHIVLNELFDLLVSVKGGENE